MLTFKRNSLKLMKRGLTTHTLLIDEKNLNSKLTFALCVISHL